MAKPLGPICNLNCNYCYYLEKQALYPGETCWRMSDDVLEHYVRQYIESQDVPEISFAWQGGEPTLLGVDFFRRVMKYQQRYANGKRITNALQTNGTLLDDAWCELFSAGKFLIGISIDGPAELHDIHRADKKGRPTFERVLAGLALLKKHGIEFNTLCVVNRANSRKPLEVYDFLRVEGSGYMQFIPLVERLGTQNMFAEPPPARDVRSIGGGSTAPVTKWSVQPAQYGAFLSTIFDKWVRNHVGSVFVQNFDVMLGVWMGIGSSLCVFGETCGSALAIEHNGDLYSCDHFVYRQYKLGNIMETSLREMVDSAQQSKFGTDKRDGLPKYCRECAVRFACNGECPKHRFMNTPDGEAGLNYLCAGYRKFFAHIDPYMRVMAKSIRTGRPAADIMKLVNATDEHAQAKHAWASAKRNEPCPCGSGLKYKKCCQGTRDNGNASAS